MSTTLFLLRLSPDADAVTDALAYGGRELLRALPGELGQRARIALHELGENAGKFAVAGTPIVIEALEDGQAFEVRVSNDAVPARTAMLRKHLDLAQELTTTADYARTIKRHLEGRGDPSISPGIGLLRARHDAIAELALVVDGRRVTVVATGRSEAPVGRGRSPSSTRNRMPPLP